MAHSDDPETRDDAEGRPGERIIDVSDREPVIVEDESRLPFFAAGTERVRVYTAGGGRACAIPAIVILLLICCACAGFWVLVDNFF